MSFLTAASERSSSGLTGASGVPSPPFSVLSESLAALFCAFTAPALSGGALVALVSVSSSVVTGLVSVFATLRGVFFGSPVGAALVSVFALASGFFGSGFVSALVFATGIRSALGAAFVSTLGDAFAAGFVAVLAATFGSIFGAALTGALAAGFTGDAFAFGFSTGFMGAFALALAATFAAGLTAAFGAALGAAFATGFAGAFATGLLDTFAAGFGAAFGLAAAGFDVLLEAAFEGTLVAIWLDAPGPAYGPSSVQILAGKCDAQGGPYLRSLIRFRKRLMQLIRP